MTFCNASVASAPTRLAAADAHAVKGAGLEGRGWAGRYVRIVLLHVTYLNLTTVSNCSPNQGFNRPKSHTFWTINQKSKVPQVPKIVILSLVSMLKMAVRFLHSWHGNVMFYLFVYGRFCFTLNRRQNCATSAMCRTRPVFIQ